MGVVIVMYCVIVSALIVFLTALMIMEKKNERTNRHSK